MTHFDCGCEISLPINWDTIPDCSHTWDTICEGNTKGIFQLESGLGRSWAKKIRPRSIEELSDLIAVIRPGCISKDTKIITKAYIRKNGNYNFYRETIEEIYNKFQKSEINKIVSYNEKTGKFFENNITNVIYTGEKDVYSIDFRRLRKKNSYSYKDVNLKCTEDHKILTTNGWKELKDMKPGDRFAIVKYKSTQKPKKHVAGKSYFHQICFENYEYKCVFCDWNNASLDVHHLEGNRYTDNSPENLVYLCPNHHREVTDGCLNNNDILSLRNKYKLPQSEDIVWAEYLEKKYEGKEKVYDISVDGPNHNFIAGNTIVHNCLEAKLDDGKSLTQHYSDRKNGSEPTKYIHPSLEPILSSTYGILVYQEQALLIARDIAGYTLSEADVLRKVIGKKKAEEMTKQKDLFIDGCKKTGIVDADTAKDIFDWIEKSQRYSFNKSHSVSYAMIGYQTAYAKTHYTKEFLCASLRYAQDKINPDEEVAELVADCKNYNISVVPPYINQLTKDSFHIRRGQIYFGPTDIKKFGDSDFQKLKQNLLLFFENQTTIRQPGWDDFLFSVFFVKNSKVSKTAVENLIMSGGLDYLSLDRQRMKYEYSIYSELTEKEREWISRIDGSLTTKIKTAIDSYDEYQKDKSKKHLKSLSSLKRQEKIKGLLDLLERPPYSLEDSDAVNLLMEKKLLGTPVTVSVLTGYNTYLSNCTCANFKSGFEDNEIIICAKITRTTEYTVKSGKNMGKIMCFLTIEDDTTSIECVVFANDYPKIKEYLYEGNILAFIGVRSYDGKSFCIKKITEI